MNFLTEVAAFFLSVAYFFLVPLFNVFPCYNDYSFEINAAETGDTLPNAVSNINRWNMNDGLFVDPEANPDNNIFEFVEYVQFMQCTGGSADRDLFKDPFDFDTLDDYDFTSLIENCRGVLKMGAKPHLKTGSVPLKYSALARTDTTFGTNPYPPDDYDVYYDYIYAIGEALVNEFGAKELQVTPPRSGTAPHVGLEALIRVPPKVTVEAKIKKLHKIDHVVFALPIN